ncbi:serine hydrolase [Deinococcus sp. HMF7620]|uniref:Serine hydrolase n=1 Tax=Deinococcus arboris TaxID=2682977 RepID=A0A7C9I0L5_9DEIO|nr:serine hydrolase domain-containing protein [Deinococcus arboris]MVN87955.1 serine hydrolase [Deinococcus arboris]
MFRDPASAALTALGEVLGRDLRPLRGPLRRALAHGGVVGAARGEERVLRPLGGVPAEGVFELASVTKPFTAALAASLVQAARLDWDAPLAALGGPLRGVPAFVTPRALATHTAGLPLHPARVGVTTFTRFHDPYGGMSPAAVVASARRWARPGGRFQYSNLGAGLLALASAYAAGEAFSAAGYGGALQVWVTGRLGVEVTLMPTSALVRPGGWEGQTTGFGPLAGAGGLFGTAGDLLTFGAAHLSGGVVTPWPVPQRPAGLPPALSGVAPGWFARGAVRWHDGAARGTRTALGFHAQTGAVVTVLARGGLPLLGPRSAVSALLLALLEGDAN